ncbi:MAG: hypothetical protein A3F70_17200 [Acidobacteria bacterium RIFCSPLOWO2_12_FULL_67_14]|nr:MAG: hypothetical protein A3H29_04880 [Acidobacteria bacterium RIFCSPLOWO2_02_FULL_67_21]OFW35917.1 MAG: hypothetical protein A3F70_17200 [Acidobacteria bacterium RIFCSPLOWO2_12_FULL_67_14]
MVRICSIAILLMILAADAARAQAPQAAPPSGDADTFRVYVSVNGAIQSAAADFADGAATRVHAEDGRFETTYAAGGGTTLDVSGGGRVWRALGVSVGMTRFSAATPGAFSASVPHPFFFNQARSISGDVTGLTREEVVVHLQASGVFPVHPRVQLALFGGPAFFRVKQGLVTSYTYSESYPYDEAALRSTTTSTARASKTGFSAGVDVAFYFLRNLGVGAVIRYAGTTVTLPGGAGTAGSVDVKVGGTQTGAGLRVRF